MQQRKQIVRTSVRESNIANAEMRKIDKLKRKMELFE